MAFESKILFSDKFEEKLFQRSTLISIANKEFEGSLDAGSVKINDYDADVTIGDYNDSTGMGDAEALTGTTRTLNIDKDKFFNIRVSDKEKLQDNNKIERWANGAANKMVQTIEADIYSIKDTVGVNLDDQNIETLDLNNLISWIEGMRVKLENKGVYGQKFLTVNPAIMSLFRQANLYTLSQEVLGNSYGPQDVYVYGDIVLSETSAMGNTGVVDLVMGTFDFLNLVQGINNLETYRPEKFFGDAIKGNVVYGVGTFNTVKAEVLRITV